jgi:hypothetical protein
LSPSDVEAWLPAPCPVQTNASFERVVEAIWPAGL